MSNRHHPPDPDRKDLLIFPAPEHPPGGAGQGCAIAGERASRTLPGERKR